MILFLSTVLDDQGLYRDELSFDECKDVVLETVNSINNLETLKSYFSTLEYSFLVNENSTIMDAVHCADIWRNSSTSLSTVFKNQLNKTNTTFAALKTSFVYLIEALFEELSMFEDEIMNEDISDIMI